jgi:hypothetical protein
MHHLLNLTVTTMAKGNPPAAAAAAIRLKKIF